MKGEKIAIFGQKVPKNIYLSNKCLEAESSKEYMHTFCNGTCLLEGWEEKACTKLHNWIL